MEELGEEFNAVHQPGTGAVEQGVSIHGEDAAGADRAEVAPGGMGGEGAGFVERAAEVESARRHDEDVGIGAAEVVPGGFAAALTGSGEEGSSAGAGDEVGHPVGGDHEGLDPFDAGDGGSLVLGRGRKPRGDGVQARVQLVDQGAGGGRAIGGLADAEDVVHDRVQGGGVEGDDAGAAEVRVGVECGVDVAVADGADFAVGLGDDEVGAKGGEAVGVDDVQGRARGEQGANLGVDGRAGGVRVDVGAGDAGFEGAGWREIALVADGHDVVAEAEGVEDFGGGGEQGGNARGGGGIGLVGRRHDGGMVTPARAGENVETSKRRRIKGAG